MMRIRPPQRRRRLATRAGALVCLVCLGALAAPAEAAPPAGPAAPQQRQHPGGLQQRARAIGALQFRQRANRFGRGDADETLADGMFLPPERETTQKWMNAARDFLEQQRYNEAVRLLQRVLQTEEDFFEPTRENPAVKSVKAEAEAMLGGMPRAGREAYELLYGAEAEKLLEEAISSGKVEHLETVSRKYFHTPAGYRATYLLAESHLNHGRPMAAALSFQRLQQSPAAAELEPSLSFKIAACWRWAGSPQRTAAVLEALRRDHPRGRIRLGGRDVGLFDKPSPAMDWLAAVGAAAGDSADFADGWTMFRGNPARTGVTRGSKPLLNHRWRIRMSDDPRVLKMAGDLQNAFNEQKMVAMPCAHPLVIDDVVLMRTSNRLLGVDLTTGKRIWQVQEDGEQELLARASTGSSPFQSGTSQASTALEQRLWNDLTYGMISSDGRNVFLVQGLGYGGRYNNTRVFLPNGQRAVDAGGGNRLQARELATDGKLKWEVGGMEEAEDSPLADAFFLGPPLPVQGTLYTLAELRGEVRLLALDADTGKLQWSQQLVLADPPLSEDHTRRLAGVTPSYADGLLVCPTSAGAVVAVDVTNRVLRWGYRYDRAASNALNRLAVLQGRSGTPRDTWGDTTVTIADGKVIMTPLSSASLHCVSLVSGESLWTVPRNDGLYVACVHENKVVVAGRTQVSAYNLADGEAAWPPIPLGEASVPSGRGFQSGARYYLPLSSAEIAVIDLDNGRVIDRVVSRSGQTPGNLVVHGDDIISQNAEYVDCFHQLAPLRERVQQALARNDRDPEALASLGEILLSDYKLAEAIERLRLSYQLRPSDHTRSLLLEALLEGLEADFAAHRGAVPEIESLIDAQHERTRFLRLLASGMQSVDEPLAALDSYLQLADLRHDAGQLEPVGEWLQVRRDRWIRARLIDLHRHNGAEVRAAIEERIQDRLRAALAAEKPQPLRQFIEFFGDQPAAERARRELARRLSRDGALLETELLLGRMAGSEQAEQARAADAWMARILATAGRTPEAAFYYKRLRDEHAGAVCLDGKTGRQLVEELPADSPVRAALTAPTADWPRGRVEITDENKASASYRTYAIDAVGGAVPRTTVHWDQQRQAVMGVDDAGRKVWSVSVSEPGRRLFYVNPAVNRARLHGHFLLMSLGYEVLAIDTLGREGSPRVLWRRDLTETVPGVQRVNYGIRTRMVRQPWGEQQYFATDSFGRPVGMLGPVADHYVCFQRGREVMALDPMSGETLWRRLGIAPGSMVFGDDDRVFVAAPDTTSALVLRASDGHELGRRDVARSSQIMAPLGGKLLVWKPGTNVEVSLQDPWEKKTVWTRSVDRNARAAILGSAAVAVMEPGGKFLLLDVADGKPLIDEQLEATRVLNDIHVMRSADQYLLVANGTAPRDPTVGYVNPIPGGVNNPTVNGRVYAFDRKSGKLNWSREVHNQGLLLDQPGDVPVLVFACHIYRRVGNRGDTQHAVLCLDKRTGEVVYDQEMQGTISNYQVRADAEEHRVQLDLTRKLVTMHFTDKPREQPQDDPPEKTPPEAPEQD